MPRWTKRGLVLPGYKYLGPFNDLNKGFPTNKADTAALIHDEAYAGYAKKHAWYAPYIRYNRADERFIKDTENETDYGARIGNAFFKAKRWFAPRLKEDDLEQVVEAAQAKVLGKRKRSVPEATKRMVEANAPQTLSNLQADAQPMSGGGGSGNPAGLRETPIDAPDRKHPVQRGPPDYTFATLPYIRDKRVRTTRWTFDEGYRMTSPYDPSITAAAFTDLNAGVGQATVVTVEASDASDVTATPARWFDFYATMYNYYHVLGVRWHMTVENLKTDPLWLHVLYFNDEVPPLGATNEDIMCWNDAESHYIGSHAMAVTSTGEMEANHTLTNANNVEGNGGTSDAFNYESGNHVSALGNNPILKISGSYRPGQKKRQIHLDSEVENWTSVSANPALPEKLLFRFKPYWNGIDTNDATNYDRTLAFRYTFRCEYLVEFKELKTGLRWPVERQPLIAAIQTNIEEDDE